MSDHQYRSVWEADELEKNTQPTTDGVGWTKVCAAIHSFKMASQRANDVATVAVGICR